MVHTHKGLIHRLQSQNYTDGGYSFERNCVLCIHSDEGLTLETSVFESFTTLWLIFYFSVKTTLYGKVNNIPAKDGEFSFRRNCALLRESL